MKKGISLISCVPSRKIGNWLQLFRSPILPVLMLPVMAGFLAGGGNLFSPLGVAFFVWSWIVHHLTFAHNSLADFMSGHDLEKSPETRPLVRRSISTVDARKVVYLGLTIAMSFGAILAMFAGGCASLSLVSLMLFYVFGHAYNGLSKYTAWSFLLISFAFTCLPAFSYFAVANSVSSIILILMVFTFLTMWFEVDWEGGLKDIKINEENLLRNLGVKLNMGRLKISLRGKIFAWTLKLFSLIIITYGIFRYTLTLSTMFAWSVLVGIVVISTFNLTVDQNWNKGRILTYIGLGEVASFSLALVLVVSIVGWTSVLTLIIFSTFWVPYAGKIIYPVAWKHKTNTGGIF